MLRLILFFCGFFAAIEGLAKRENPRTRVADLRFGVALYDYYQGDYLGALTELMVAEARGGIKGHGDEPRLMEGGFSLAYGMERHASQIFEAVLEENRSVKIRDAAWFFMARLRYLRNDWPASQDALTKISRRPHKDLQADLLALRVNLGIRQNQLDQVTQLITFERPDQGWLPYVRYNLGTAWARQGEYDKAIENFNELAKKELLATEHQALFDKAMTAAGYSYLLSERYGRAIDRFSLVRLKGGLSNKALLGYGWAALELGDYKEAIKPWKHLVDKASLLDESTLEALVALPYAYEKLGSQRLALTAYLSAEATYIEEIDYLTSVIQQLKDKNLADFLAVEASDDGEWVSYSESTESMPELRYLSQLFTQEKFRGLVQELRDLMAIEEKFHAWQQRMSFYLAMIERRQIKRQSRGESMVAQQFRESIKNIEDQRRVLARKIEAAGVKEDYFALASKTDEEMVARVTRSREHIETLRDTDPFIDENEELIRRYHGLLLWQASEKFSDRFWVAQKSLYQLDQALIELNQHYERSKKLMRAAPDLPPLKARTEKALQAIDDQIQQTQAMIDVNQSVLRDQMLSVLEAQQERLTHYLAQARLSIAHIYDRARVEAGNE